MKFIDSRSDGMSGWVECSNDNGDYTVHLHWSVYGDTYSQEVALDAASTILADPATFNLEVRKRNYISNGVKLLFQNRELISDAVLR